MSRTVVVRYRTRPEAADENARLVEAVFAALDDLKPEGFRYTCCRLADGVTFVHTAHFVDAGASPLAELPAFAEFQRGIADRCEEQPVADEATVVGSFG